MAWTSTTKAKDRTLAESIEVFSEEVVDDSDKTFAVATDGSAAYYEVLGIRLEVVADATVGTRTWSVQVLDSAADVVVDWPMSTGADVTASASLNIELSPGSINLAAIGGTAREFLPRGLMLRQGDSLRVFDRAAIAAAGDDMIVHLRLRGVSPST